MVESLGSWWRSLTHRNDDDEHDADDDTLDDATNALLSMLPLASIVVDEHDEVIRAHPSAYSLGVVRDDVIIEDSVLQAVREVRSFGGKKQFDLTTTTAYVAQHTPKAGKLSTRQAAKQALIGQQPAGTVDRPANAFDHVVEIIGNGLELFVENNAHVTCLSMLHNFRSGNTFHKFIRETPYS